MNHADVVVFGSGPTAVFAYDFLRRAGAKVRLVGSFAEASVAPVDTPSGPVTLVPVFPPAPPFPYPPSVHSSSLLSVARFGDSSWVDSVEFAKESLLGTFGENRDGGAMTQKQYGALSRVDPMVEVRRKVARAYGSTPIKRMGYVDGLSPYFPTMTAALEEAIPAPSAVTEWNPAAHQLVIAGEETALHYDGLVYAGSLERLTSTIGASDSGAAYAPAAFSLYAAEEDLEVNRLIYDLGPDSPVFRVFTPRDRIALVQHSQLGQAGNEHPESMQRALSAIFDTEFSIVGGTTTLPRAYPVETTRPDAEATLNERCAELDILRFGRTATARYVDLHELEWDALTDWLGR